MLAVIELEAIGDNFDAYGKMASKQAKVMGVELGYRSTQPWVARITGPNPKYGWARTFIRGTKDYSRANAVGSRGVYLHFPLSDGIYEVYAHLSWKRDRRYFIKVENTTYHEISREEAERHFQTPVVPEN